MMKPADSIRIREAVPGDAAGIARVHVDSWRATYKGMVPDDYLASLNYDDRTRRWTDRLTDHNRSNVILVAETSGGKIVGFASGGPNRGAAVHATTACVPVEATAKDEADSFDGELYAIYILHEYLGRGIGRMLVEAFAKRLVEMGLKDMIVWVLSANPASHFYEALGGKLISQRLVEIGGAQLEEESYGWRDIAWVRF